MNVFPIVASIVIGIIIGYMGQRSRLCFIGGIRDYILIRDKSLLMGLISTLVVAAITFLIVGQLIGGLLYYPWFSHTDRPYDFSEVMRYEGEYDPCGVPPSLVVQTSEAVTAGQEKGIFIAGVTLGPVYFTYSIILAVIGGLGLGVFSTMANGCPFRQHVMAGQGNGAAWIYLLGFYLAALVFHSWVAPFIDQLMF